MRGPQQKENYMRVEDMLGLSRELVILNTTSHCHRNHHIATSPTGHLQLYKLHLE